MQMENWETVRSIYEQGIFTGHAAFEARPPDWRQWDTAHLAAHRLIAKEGDQVVGWAALSPASSRCASSDVAELSVYVASSHRGKRIGSLLLAAAIDSTEKAGISTLWAGVFPENTGSLGLFFKYGFREVGRFEKLGRMSVGPMEGKWRDIVLLERRSKVCGVD
jgi:phosphinothricin acetyltransferase